MLPAMPDLQLQRIKSGGMPIGPTAGVVIADCVHLFHKCSQHRLWMFISCNLLWLVLNFQMTTPIACFAQSSSHTDHSCYFSLVASVHAHVVTDV